MTGSKVAHNDDRTAEPTVSEATNEGDASATQPEPASTNAGSISSVGERASPPPSMASPPNDQVPDDKEV